MQRLGYEEFLNFSQKNHKHRKNFKFEILPKHEKSLNRLKEHDSYAEPPKEIFDQV